MEFIHDRLTHLESSARVAHLARGGSRPYDRLLIATGSRPAVPPVPGLTQPGIHTCWTLADARAIAAAARPGSRAVLVGAGFIGCIIIVITSYSIHYTKLYEPSRGAGDGGG